MTDIPPRWYCVDRHGMTTLCSDEDNARAEAAENDILWPRNAPHTAAQLAPAPAQPTITPEQARDAQSWAGMDGATAWHLIDRHADGWGDVGVMMDAWLEANRSPVPAQPAEAEGVEALATQFDGAWVPRDVLEAMAEIDVVDVDDPRGPGYTECPACGQNAQGRWEDPPHYVRPSVPHFAHCPAEFARRLRNSPQPVSSGP